ncbi:excisionase family DNA binding domain-containing protein [Flammeovirgaceae bacterium 311]|nr:excisionase family DNA binding domain-containing protein [Flammeovirgaceae bacterium 311]
MLQQPQIPNYIEILFNRIDVLEERVNILSQSQPIMGVAIQEEKQILNSQETANFLSVSLTTVYQLKAENKICCMKKGKRLYFTRESLVNFLQEGRVSAPDIKLSGCQVVQRYLKPRRKKLGS